MADDIANGTAPAHLCMNESCARIGTDYPVITFGPRDRIPGGKCDYRLEIPKAICSECQKGFRPGVFLSDASRENIDRWLVSNDRPVGDYDRLFVIWKPLSDPTWVELKAGGQARISF